MIPASFDYVKPSSIEEAVQAYAAAGEDAKILAGGQSLLPILRLRLAYPGAGDRPRRHRRADRGDR